MSMIRSRNIIATPPGSMIKEQLEYRNMSQKEFAIRMDMSEKHISKLVNGEVQLTPETALKLEMVLGIPAQFWNNLEAIYREKIVLVNAENAMDRDIEIMKQFPYGEMSKLGWLPESRKNKDRVFNLRKFFEVIELSLLENSQITRIACRRLRITEKGDLALIAWVQEAKIKSRSIETSSVNIKGLTSSAEEIRKMTFLSPDVFCGKMKELLAKNGVALVFLPHLKGSFLHGASFMDGNRVVLGLTTRGRDADKFWFSLFHELGHIVLGHIKQSEGTTEEDEKEADKWASNMLIPSDSFERFKEKRDFSKNSVIAFAKEQEIAPGIVVGRMQAEGVIDYSRMNDLKEKYAIVG